ncbi:MAG TPA: energy transducer TonB [Candidatus Acidoferrales bacterium]|jgi:protein TonB|nr:energy transducer TonB [Candidatus Acidoferrales bacterium]
MSDFGARLDEAGRSTSEPTLRLGQMAAPVAHGSSLKSLLSNLKDFLTERPAKVRPGSPTSFDMPEFGAGFGDNIKEFFRSGPRGRVKSDLLVNWEEEPSLWRNLMDLISPPKLPPLKTTSQPVAVPEIWSKNKQFSKVQLVSVLVHVLAIALVVLLPLLLPEILSVHTNASPVDMTPIDTTVSKYLPLLKPAAKRAGGGGGQHDLAPAVKGQAPKFSYTQFSRPIVHPPLHPEIAVTPTILGNPNIVLPNNNMNNWGDPTSHNTNGDSMGNGRGNGLGNGNGNGMGPGQQYGIGGGLPSAGTGGYGVPSCLYCPRADYSDEAMKVKVQGVVELVAVITADGKVTDVHVAKGLGFGLDEKAMEAVRGWRLTPARGPDGRPAAVREIIEVAFQLF